MSQTACRESPSTPPSVCRSRGKAMVVDDTLTNRLILQSLLRQDGYQVIMAEDGKQAVELFRTEHPDIVFMDVIMPVMDGFEATARIKSMEENGFVPVIFLTGLNDEKTQKRCIDVGGDDFLTKPYSNTVLMAKIRAMERIRDLHRKVSGLYAQVQQDQEFAERVFSGAVVADNVALDAIHTRLQPADTFSGDVLLTAHTPSGDLHVLLGDFTGHGLAAALGAMPTSEVFHSMTSKGFNGERMMEAINRKLKRSLPTGIFLAAQFVKINKELRYISVCNCGMPDILLLDGGSGEIRRRLSARGLPLGVVEGSPFHETFERVSIHPGDRVLLVSDGVTEAHSPSGEMFGKERLAAAIEDGRKRPFVLDSIDQALDAFCGDAVQTDDISLVEIPCTEDVLSAAQTVAPSGNRNAEGGEGTEEAVQGGWDFSLAIEGACLRDTNPVPLFASQAQEIMRSRFQCQTLSTILTELYVNALDHGVLGLDSSLKSGAEGMLRYFDERSRRLEALSDGWVRIDMRIQPMVWGGRAVLRIEDSGPGFNFSAVTMKVDPGVELSGRGLGLVRGLCESLRFEEPGNRVEAVFVSGTVGK